MRRSLVILGSIAALAGALRLTSACIDLTPVIVERDASLQSDASCLRCLKEPGNCDHLITDCYADPRCAPVYACVERDTCLDLPTLDDKIKCGLPCAADAGITRLDDPIVDTYLVGLVACARETCEAPCNLADASFGL